MLDDRVAEVVVLHTHGLHVGNEGGGIEGGRLGVDCSTGDTEPDGRLLLKLGGREGERKMGGREGGEGGKEGGTYLEVEQHV